MPTAIAADDTYVYYATSDGVTRVTIADKMVTPLATGQGLVSALVLDASNVYWTTSMMGSVVAVPIDAGTPTPLATAQTKPAALVLDGDNAYWINQSLSAGSVMSVALDGGTPAPLASGQAGPLALAISDSDAYFANQDGHGHESAARRECCAQPDRLGSGCSFFESPWTAKMSMDQEHHRRSHELSL